jgi:hypothetical protein
VLAHGIVGTGSPKSTGLTRKLETQTRVDVAVLSMKSVGKSNRLKTDAEFS